MRRRPVSRIPTAAALVAILLAISVASGVQGATPATGSIGPSSGSTTSWDFAPVGPGVSSGGTIEAVCAPGVCDSYALHVVLPAADQTFYTDHAATLNLTYTWTSTQPNDMDIFAFAPDGTESGPGSPDDQSTGPGQEVLSIANPASGTWTIESHVGVTPVPTPAHTVAVLTWHDVKTPTPPPQEGGGAWFTDASPPLHYQSTDVLERENAGEPSLGLDWHTHAAMYMAGTQVSRVTFNNSVSPPAATWTDVTPVQQGEVNEDAIVFTDHISNRTFAEGLAVAGSNGSYSDDDGTTWQQAAFPVPHGPDHETVGGGKYASPVPPGAGSTGYNRAVYYCSQNIVQAAGAFCARSDTGGATYNPSVPVFGASSPCGSIHGHVKVAPDGTVYVPQLNCHHANGKSGQGMAVSRDNGQTWTYSVVTQSSARSNGAGSDPSIGIGAMNSVYFGFENGNGHPMIAVSHDHGQTWSGSMDVGTAYGIQNTKFAEVVAGDDNRAAFAFLGSTSAGDDQSATFPGVWYLYVSFTYDRGAHWHTVVGAPGNVIQRGCIWNGGGSNACRNLLDFNDIGVDQDGRVLVAFTDGCADIDFSYHTVAGGVEGLQHGPSKCESNPNSYKDTDKVSFDGLVRQSCGESLFERHDADFTNFCPAPRVASEQPANKATHVPVATRVGATFDEIVTSATLTLNTRSGAPVGGTTACTSPCVTVTFTPNAPLRKGTSYVAHVSASNKAGHASLTWSFTTSP